MGKKNNNSKYQEAYDMNNASAKAVKAGAKKKDMTNVWVTLVIAILVLGSVLLFVFSSTGIVERSKKLAYTDNYSVDGTMISYYEGQLLNQAFSTYFNYYYQMTYDYETAYNYAQQYVMSQSYREGALDLVKEVLILCEGAKAAGITLDADDNKLIADNIEQMGDIQANFGAGVFKSDVRKALEIQLLANKYYEKFVEDSKAAVTTDAINTYMDAHKADFYIADYLGTELVVLAEDYADDKEGFAAAKALVDEYATKLESAKTVDEFNTYLVEYTVKSQFNGLAQTEIDSAIMPDQATLVNYKNEMAADIVKLLVNKEEMELGGGAEGTIEKALATIKETLVGKCNTAISGAEATQAYVDAESESYTEDAAWLASSDRKLGDTKKVAFSDEAEYSYTVYMIVEPVHVNNEMSRNVGHILVTADKASATEEEIAAAKAKADEILAEYLASAKTEESFEEIGWKYTEDSNVFYDNVLVGDMVEEFESWLFDASRNEGDTGVVQSPYGFHVMLYRGEEELSLANAKSGIVSEKYSEYLTSNEAKVTIK